MGVVVDFDYVAWVSLFPEFTNVSQDQAQMYFDLATVYHRNDGGGPVKTASSQSALLNLMTSHIAWLLSPRDSSGKPSSVGTGLASPLVGRINNASEGSVSVGVELPMTPNMAWFAQTQYGLMYWQATAPYRTMRYKPGMPRLFNPTFTPGWPY